MPQILSLFFVPRFVLTAAVALAALFGMIPRSAADSGADAATKAAETKKKKIPPFTVVESLVSKQLAKKPGYQSGDLITRGDIDPVIPQLALAGFDVREVSRGLQVLMADDHMLVVLLRSPQGAALMTKIKNPELALDRLDRLCHFAEGQDLVKSIIGAPNGLEIIEQLCLAETAKGLAVKYPNESVCQSLDLPSGRAFTERQYIERLRTIHMLAERGLTRPGE